ncbi:MAG: helix-turn-helix domain-containing protein [Haloechinothrix sp.]
MASRPRRGRITGYVFKLVRESIPRSQTQLASDLGVDRATIQGWESGRRPYTSVAVGQAIALRHKLSRLGAAADLLAALDQAAEADFLLSEVIDTDPVGSDLAQHPLGWTVLNHGLTEMLTWAVTGQAPQSVARYGRGVSRRGPVPDGPELDACERRACFTNLRTLMDRARRRDGHILLHRQACFLSGFDPTLSAVDWLSSRRPHDLDYSHGWSLRWADARSLAASMAKQGDPEPMREFIARAHPDSTCEMAGLNYWAYWVGETQHRQRDDMFMIDSTFTWRGARLLRHLVDRFHSSHAFIDLNVHSLWALLAARRGIAEDHPATTRDSISRGERLMDEGEISEQSRRELASVLYGLRMEGFTGRAGG